MSCLHTHFREFVIHDKNIEYKFKYIKVPAVLELRGNTLNEYDHVQDFFLMTKYNHLTNLIILTSPKSKDDVKGDVTALIIAPIVKEPCPNNWEIWGQCWRTILQADTLPPGFRLTSFKTVMTS